MDRDAEIISSWDANANLWTGAVRTGAIPSRAGGTDQAIIDAATSLQPGSFIDIGCGEGWLVRRLTAGTGCRGTGVDGSPALIAAAQAEDNAEDNDRTYFAISYEQIIANPRRLNGPYDLAICNFSLLSAEISGLVRAVSDSLAPTGSLLVQTLHPWSGQGDGGYRDQWREETFAAFENGDWQPMPWFYRTLASWFREFEAAGLDARAVREPLNQLNQETGQPLSIIFHAVRRD